MTWKEFKEKVEAAGITNNTKLDWYCDFNDNLHFYVPESDLPGETLIIRRGE